MKKRIARTAAVLFAALMLVLVPVTARQVPTLFWNDEVWFRDAISPLIERDGVHYIPADLCAMFDSVTVEMPSEDNVLIFNRETGKYISALIDSGKAAVNGEIVETESFRSGGVCYLDAELVCRAIELTSDYLSDENGETISMRLSDSDELVPLIDLAQFNSTDGDEYEDTFFPDDDPPVSETKILYILCESDSGGSFSICDALERYGLQSTCFIRSGAGTGDIFLAASRGEFGIIADGSVRYADMLNEECRETVKRTARAVILAGGDADEYENGGYAVITPDVTVDGGTSAMESIRDAINHLADHDSCVIYVKTSWSGQEFVRLVSELDPYIFKTANIESAN